MVHTPRYIVTINNLFITHGMIHSAYQENAMHELSDFNNGGTWQTVQTKIAASHLVYIVCHTPVLGGWA